MISPVKKRPRTISASLALVVVLLAGVPASASSPNDDVIHDDCWDVVSFITVPVDAVRPRVPARFRLQGEETGTATLFIRSAACAGMTVRGVTTPTVFSHFAVLVEPLAARENICAVPGAPEVTLCSWYVFEMATNNPTLVSWARDDTSLGTRVVHVPDMSFRFQEGGPVLRYSFDLPAPAASPFSMTAIISPEETIPWCEDEFCLWVDYYLETSQDLVHIGGTSDLTSHAGHVEVTPRSGSLMAEMFVPSQSRTSTAPFTYNRWDPGIWMKSVTR